MENKKYHVSYTSGATGYGWDKNFDTIDQVEYCIGELVREKTAMVTVFDRILSDFVFWKNVLTYEFDIDFIFKNGKRDLRTKTRLVNI